MGLEVQTTYSSSIVAGISGTLDATTPHQILTMKNVEASAEIAFGRAVAFKTSSPTSDLDAILPASESAVIAGIVLHSDSYARAWTVDGTTYGDLGTTGLRPGALMDVLRKGRVLVKVEDAVAVGDRLWVRGVASGDPEFLGGLTNADDSTDTVDCTKQGVFESSASAGGLAWLSCDFTAKP